MQEKIYSGFSRLSKQEKLEWVAQQMGEDRNGFTADLQSFWYEDASLQDTLDGFSENTLSNYILPMGVSPNFLIDGKMYNVPMVIEESSVVAAAASAAKFWASRGGFHTEVVSTLKLGQVHLMWEGAEGLLEDIFPQLEKQLREEAAYLTASMEKRGGGIRELELLRIPDISDDYYQLLVSFETCDSMGANFINSVLEQFGNSLEHYFNENPQHGEVEVVMSILSNYTPDCLVRAWVSCPIADLAGACGKDMSGAEFARRFELAVRIARKDPYRAVTHNKGIFNGIDAVVIATANDFRAVEACGQAYAARDGQYRSLSECTLEDGHFTFSLEIPLAIGTVGGLTKLHPLAKRALQMLGNPDAKTLMRVIASTGLAQNFAALRSLITTGIQQGHMKMHLQNILSHLQAETIERAAAVEYFAQRTISFNAVRTFINNYRSKTKTDPFPI